MMLVVFLMALAGPSPQSIDLPRRNYSACLKSFETQSIAAKMSAADYSAALKTACPTEAAALTKALVAYDVGMGTKRASAEANARIDLDDYIATSENRFGMLVRAAAPQ